VVSRFGGHVAKYMGDGILVYFGYPHAREHDAERAVCAGLRVVKKVGKLKVNAPFPMRVRVGIATGVVVVGDLIGAGAAREQAVVGDTPNLAARLQELAEANTVLIGANTHRLVEGMFDCADLGEHRLKGFSEAIRVWRVVGESRAESRFEARHAIGATPLVGREHELALLLDRWERAKDREGQVVLLSGEPGIGKSRIVRSLREALAGETHTRLSYYCSPYHQNSALYPVIEQLERAAGILRDDPPEQQLDKVETLLATSTTDVGEATQLIAALLSIPAGERYPPIAFSPQRQKERTLEVLVAQLQGLSASQPVLMIFEDVQWIDPTSLELLDLIIDHIRSLPVLVIVTFRPEFVPRWAGHAHVTALSINRLSRRQGTAMVERLTNGKTLPAEVLDQIVARTDGVPLFVEELTKTVLESGLLRQSGARYELTGALPPLAIPTTLRDSLMARLDRLAPVKEVAQFGAAIGREFSFELLAAVSPLDDDGLQKALDQLVHAELVFRRGVPPHAVYTFKHALVQDAAYGTLLRGKRHELHGRIAAVLEEQFPDSTETQPELVAHHYTQAGIVQKAVEYWYKAGQRAISRSATAEAIAHLEKGLEVLQRLPAGAERDQLELGLQAALGGMLIAAKGFAAPETGKAYVRARELSEQLGEVRQRFPVLYGLSLFHLYRGETGDAHAVAEDLLRLGERDNRPGDLFFAHRALGVTALPRGRFDVARIHLERALTLYDPTQHRSGALFYSFDPHIVCLDYLSRSLLPLGYLEQALQRRRETLQEARDLGHPNTLALALFFGCVFFQMLQDRRAVRERAKALLALAAEEGFAFWTAGGTIVQGWATATGSEIEAGIARMREGLAAWRTTGAEYMAPYFLGLIAEAHAQAGQIPEALELLDESIGRSNKTDEAWFRSELHRMKAELLLSTAVSDPAEAEIAFKQAIAVAQMQQARLWELRAAIGLGRLWRDRGRRSEAHALIAPLHAWFREGLDTVDLKAAAALVEELH
jgi:predicted ATPase